MVSPSYTVGQFLEMVQQKKGRPELRFVWLEGSSVDLTDPLADFHPTTDIFILTADGNTPAPAWVASLAATGGPTIIPPTSPPAAPPPVPAVVTRPQILAGPDPKAAHLQSNAGVTKNDYGQITTDFVAPPATGTGEFRVFTSVNYESMTKGVVYNFSLTATPAVVIDKLLPDVKKLSSDLPSALQLRVSLPGGIPFRDGTLGDFFGISELSKANRNLYVVQFAMHRNFFYRRFVHRHKSD
jgi:hypothetical protein